MDLLAYRWSLLLQALRRLLDLRQLPSLLPHNDRKAHMALSNPM